LTKRQDAYKIIMYLYARSLPGVAYCETNVQAWQARRAFQDAGKGGGLLQMAKDKNAELDIAKNIRLVEWLKSEILTSVAEVYRLLANGIKGSQEALADCLSSIIVAVYLLGRRLGISYDTIGRRIESKIRLGIVEEHDVEKYYGDLTSLGEYCKTGKEG